MRIFPAIDLLGGAAVRLEQGRRESAKIYDRAPWEVAARFAAAAIQPGRAGAEGPLARHHQLVGARDHLRVGAHDHVGADRGERLGDAAQVPAPKVGDRDPRCAHFVSVPLVDGTPTTRGSSRAAIEAARAKALKSASIMWCAFSP